MPMSNAARLLKQVDVTWDVDEWNELLARTEQLGRQRARRRRVATGVTVAALVVSGAGGALRWGVQGLTQHVVAGRAAVASTTPSLPVVESLPGSSLRTLRFDDGSAVTLLTSASTLVPREVTARRTEVELLSGSARFEVAQGPARTFNVRSGAVSVQVAGTVFVLDRMGGRNRISVERGLVKVGWTGGERALQAGETGVFPPETPGERPSGTPVVPAVPEMKDGSDGPATVGAAPQAGAVRSGSWRRLARAQEFRRAYQVMQTAVVADEPNDLLLAADVARLSGHPQKAVSYLRAVVARYPADQRASAAAFTLGRVLLEDLQSPADAEAAFARSRALAPTGILAEDALFRQIEAAVQTGQTARAQALAEQYRNEYPQGRRRRSIERIVPSE